MILFLKNKEEERREDWLHKKLEKLKNDTLEQKHLQTKRVQI